MRRAISSPITPATGSAVRRSSRESGRGYYRSACFKLFARVADEWLDIGDGGDVDWTAQLLSDRRERLFISGVGSERVAVLPKELADRERLPPR